MSSLDFPLNPVDSQEYSLNGVTYYYNAALGAWLTKLSSAPLPTAFNRQVLFNDAGLSNGSYGLVFDKSANTLFANTINVSSNMRVTGNLYIGSNTVTITDTAVMARSLFVMNDAGHMTSVPSGSTSNLAFDTANAAYAAANNVGPQIAPTYNTANAAFSKANTALQNTSGTFAGDLSISGNVNLSLGTSALIVPKGTTAQRPTGVVGMVRFNTTTDALENYISTGWTKVSAPLPTLTSVSGTIYNGFASTLTLIGTNFGSSANVNFKVSGTTVATSTVTPTSGGTSISVSVPSGVYGQSVSTTVSITVTNDDLMTSTGVDKTVAAMPSGGTITTSGNYRIHAFYSSSSFVNTISSLAVDYMIIAGGGGGGTLGGGGGAGGYLTGSTSLSATSFTATIGAGGVGGGQNVPGGYGGNSSCLSLTAIGGGGGGSHYSGGSSVAGTSGGSGGGGSDNNNSAGPGSGTAGQGYAGGNGSPTYGYDPRGGGGGGGSAAVGGNYNGPPHGGAGTLNSILGTSYYWAGGGGGNLYSGTGNGGNGGIGGGGGGNVNTGVNGSAGTGGGSAINSGGNGTKADSTLGGTGGQNTGGGGGGCSWGINATGLSSGGSGIVVIRYLINNL